MLDESQCRRLSGSVVTDPSSSNKACTAGSSYFERALAQVMANEGGFVDDPGDSATNWGMSLRPLCQLLQGELDGSGEVDVQDIRCLTRDASKPASSAAAAGGSATVTTPEPIGIKVFDQAVNMGRYGRTGHYYSERLELAGNG